MDDTADIREMQRMIANLDPSDPSRNQMREVVNANARIRARLRIAQDIADLKACAERIDDAVDDDDRRRVLDSIADRSLAILAAMES